MQKIINVLALGSFAVSAAVVGAAGYVYVNQDAIVDGIKRLTDICIESDR